MGQLIGLDFSAAPAGQRLGTDARLLVDRTLAAGLWLERLAGSDGSPVVLLLGARALCHLQTGRWDDAVESAQTAITGCQAVAQTQFVAQLRARLVELPALAQMGALSGAPLDLAGRLAAWRVLHRASDAAASAQLTLAEAELQQRLDAFDDERVRQRVAQDVPWQRGVLDAVEQHKHSQDVGA